MGKDGLRRRNGVWHIETSIRGRRIRETLGTDDRMEALALLRQRVAGVERHGPLALRAPKLTFDDLAAGLTQDYLVNGRRSVGKAQKSIERLREFFGGWKATTITTADVRTYISNRQAIGYANGSINRELAALKRMFRLAVKAKLITMDHVPSIDLLQEAPPRSGFLEREQFEAIVRHLPAEIKPVAQFGYEFGWRLREILGLQWRQVNLAEGSVRLDPAASKNRLGRLAYLSPRLSDVLKAQAILTRELERKRGVIIPSVFHRSGRPIATFYRAWRSACRKAGVPGAIFHDMRRSSIRNLLRAGVSERVAMMISGHKTRSIFERYNIVSDGDLRQAAQRLAAAQSRNDHERRSDATDP